MSKIVEEYFGVVIWSVLFMFLLIITVKFCHEAEKLAIVYPRILLENILCHAAEEMPEGGRLYVKLPSIEECFLNIESFCGWGSSNFELGEEYVIEKRSGIVDIMPKN